MFVYNIQKDKWFFGGTMPEPRNYHTAAYLNGKIYVIGLTFCANFLYIINIVLYHKIPIVSFLFSKAK